ncbi:NAD(P)-dependent dehydrogenase (short-subunit alcohol dehydrogenase family) [Crossiella equi]|uniref:NAD(P)-dependent dehydrogenase (Short-subunit alcohol dehydrogenase family) n=1 Tax=Crossiella equi TaxID=130796 RepID=A0ABS5A7T0_9PSEU|nr:SDR family NAD(P)-dependent oxidoreductase [Crossiella equi]MBP2472649.1 NAD(P)-dependent dehydrogenase (short-subunit alcohol dehydrogenase family) [Crossiella equi]
MTSKQHPIGSGFTRHSTTTDVLAGIDLTGKTAIVTGGYSGLGLETTRAFVQAGAHVLVPARRPILANETLDREGLDGVEVAALDLADLDSVRTFAEGFLATGRGIDMLVNSAGVMACPEARTAQGWELQFATNHLGHFALVNRLWPALRDREARVVSVSSLGHQGSGIHWDDVHLTRGYDPFTAYSQSKTANVLFALHLDLLGREHGVRAFSLHPGKILTELARHIPHAEMVERGWVDEHGEVIDPTFKTPAQGAATQTWAATSPQLNGLGGLYLADCEVGTPGVGTEDETLVAPHAVDPEQASRLWAYSAELTGVDLAFTVR